MLKNYGKITISITLLSLFLLILGVRYVLGQDLEILNIVAFAAFSIVVGVFAGALLIYKLKKAFYSFTIGLAIGFIDMFRSFILNMNNEGDVLGILSLFIFTSFGLVIGFILEGITYVMKKSKES